MPRTHAMAVMLGLVTMIGGLALHAQDPPAPDSITFKYSDDEGPGRLTITTVGEAEGGASRIRVELVQGDLRLLGSGVAHAIEGSRPPTTRYAFAVSGPRGTFFFHGETTSGITLSGQGTYHRLGSPEREHKWSIVIGGG